MSRRRAAERVREFLAAEQRREGSTHDYDRDRSALPGTAGGKSVHSSLVDGLGSRGDVVDPNVTRPAGTGVDAITLTGTDGVWDAEVAYPDDRTGFGSVTLPTTDVPIDRTGLLAYAVSGLTGDVTVTVKDDTGATVGTPDVVTPSAGLATQPNVTKVQAGWTVALTGTGASRAKVSIIGVAVAPAATSGGWWLGGSDQMLLYHGETLVHDLSDDFAPIATTGSNVDGDLFVDNAAGEVWVAFPWIPVPAPDNLGRVWRIDQSSGATLATFVRDSAPVEPSDGGPVGIAWTGTKLYVLVRNSVAGGYAAVLHELAPSDGTILSTVEVFASVPYPLSMTYSSQSDTFWMGWNHLGAPDETHVVEFTAAGVIQRDLVVPTPQITPEQVQGLWFDGGLLIVDTDDEDSGVQTLRALDPVTGTWSVADDYYDGLAGFQRWRITGGP